MNSIHRRWWLRAILCASGLAVVLLGLSWKLLQMEEQQIERRHRERTLLEPLRLALWRMDSWLAPRLALEAHRPPQEYQSYFPRQQLYNKFLQTLRPGDVLTPSPLMTLESDFIRLHFQIDAAGVFSSPQVPRGNQADLAQGTLITFESVERKRKVLESIETLLDPPAVRQCLDRLEAAPAPLVEEEPRQQRQQTVSQQEYSKRSSIVNAPVEAQRESLDSLDDRLPETPVEALSGPMTPVWLAGAEHPELCFLRRVRFGSDLLIQGFLTDWPVLSGILLKQVEDLFEAASLVPLLDATAADNAPARLAGLPARLEVPYTGATQSPFVTPTGILLVALWIAVLLMLLSGARTLRASIAFGEQRSRFASSVTHELRTPLTTLQLYSEMLADGLVSDAQKRKEFQTTIKHEAARLASLVENVLAYSRLEEGGRRIDTGRISCRELLDLARAQLEGRIESAGLRLEVELCEAQDAPLQINSDVMVQVLSNLVDNACKYGTGSEEIRLCAEVRDGHLRIAVRDAGPGVPRSDRERIFRAFERGPDPSGKGGAAQGGIGLGLSLSRELTREMGGDLILEDRDAPGSSFVIVLPLAD